MPTYPALPGMRLAYDADGTAGWYRSTVDNGLSALTSGQLGILNDEGNDQVTCGPDIGWVTLIFPELRTITGAWGNAVRGTVYDSYVGFDTSTDTTNGVDGVWTAQQAYPTSSANLWTGMGLHRTGIWTFAASGVRACRLYVVGYTGGSDTTVRNLHVYGNIEAGQNLNRLQTWHPTSDQIADGTTLDFGNPARGTVVTQQFRVKNMSSTLTASAPRASVEFLAETSPTLSSQVAISADGSTWVASGLVLPNLAPGAISNPVHVRYTVDVAARLTTLGGRIRWDASGGWA